MKSHNRRRFLRLRPVFRSDAEAIGKHKYSSYDALIQAYEAIGVPAVGEVFDQVDGRRPSISAFSLVGLEGRARLLIEWDSV